MQAAFYTVVPHACCLKYGKPAYLRSCAGTRQQVYHYDYDTSTLESTDPVPWTLWCCLDHTGGSLYVKVQNTCMQMFVSRGDVLAFDGNVLHAGSESATESYRIHVYLDTDQTSKDTERYLHIPK